MNDVQAPGKPEDVDRSEWNRAWASQTLRRLSTPARVDLQLFPEHGAPTDVQLVAVPSEFADRVYIRFETCPVCGNATSDQSRLLVTLYPSFRNGFSYGVSAWTHAHCLASCEELPGPAPIPW